MKLKRILAGVLTAAMVIASAPMAGLGTMSVQAAGDTELSVPALAVTVPAAGSAVAAAESSIVDATTTFVTSFKDRANAGTTLVEKSGTTVEILSENGVADAFQGKFEVQGNDSVNVHGTTPFLIKFKMKPSSFDTNATQGIIGKMDEQFGVQLSGSKLAFYAKCKNGSAQNWVETGINLPSDLLNKWSDVIVYYDGKTDAEGASAALLNIWVKKPDADGTVIHGCKTSVNQNNEKIEIVENQNNKFTVGYNGQESGREYSGALAGVKMYSGEGLPPITDEKTISEATTNNATIDKANAKTMYGMLESALENLSPVLDIEASKVPDSHYTVGTSSWTTVEGTSVTGNFEAKKQYKVTATLTADEGYVFTETSRVIAVPEGVDEVESVVGADGSTMTVTYTLSANPYYKAYEYWDKERTEGTLSDQQDSDIWHYQIMKDNAWSDLPSSAYNDSATLDDGSQGVWCENINGGTWNIYDKISKYQITAFGNNMGWLWKSFGKGYYSVKLEENIGVSSTQNDNISLNVNHVEGNNVTPLMETTTLRHGGNFTTRIAKMETGEAIRIASGVCGNGNWALNVRPMIVERTAKEYATQYLADLGAQNINTEDYTTETAEAYTTAKTALEGAIAEGVTIIEDDITTKIETLEAAVAGLKEKVKFTGTTLTLDGKIGLTFYTNLTSLDGVTAASFTVDGTKTVDAVYELKNGYVACTYKLAAKEMTDEVSVSIIVNGETITSVATSAASNANALLSDADSSDTLRALVKSLLNYGAAAQVQFGYKYEEGNDTTLANASLEDKTVPAIGTSLDDTCRSIGVTAESYKGLSLVLNSETALKLYATGDTSIILKQGENVVAYSGEEKNNTFSFAKVENIAANHLQDTYTVVINNNEETTYTVSPLLYCYNVAKGEGFDANLKNLVNALYDYNQKAIAYGNSQN